MIYNLYSMHDDKTGFMAPTMDMNDESAIRNFNHAVVTSDGILYTHASDFALYRIGSFDTDHGVLDLCVPIVRLADGSAALRALEREAARDV